jgi:hypothetical protein
VAKPARKTRAARARKISITADERVLEGVERQARKSGRTLSAQVTDALARDLRRLRLRELIDAYEAEHGEITEDELTALRTGCRD